MKTLAFLSLGLAVALGMPPFAPDVAQNPVLTEEEQKPLLGDLVPVQGHVVVEDPAPQVRQDSREQQEKLALEMDQSPLYAQVKKDGMMELEPEVKPEVKMEPVEKDGMVELEVKVKPEGHVDPEPKAEQEVKMERDVKVVPEAKAEQEVKMERDVKVVPEAKADTDVHLNPEVMAELEVKVKSEVKMESEHNVGSDLKVESEVKVEPDVQWDPEVMPMFSNELQMEMNHEEETQTGLEAEERHILWDEGPALDITGRQIPPSGDYFPNEEAMMDMELAKQRDSDSLMKEGAGREFVMEEELSLFEEPAMEDSSLLDGDFQIGVVSEREKRALMQQGVKNPVERRLLPKATGQCSCPGVVLERKCYQFFRGPKRAADAEFFCQRYVPGGHLASITSQYIHREVMNMMLQQNGAYTRTWIGGLRYLETGRFIWLDGSHWSYADWLPGEPNNTADVEDCLEVLAFGNGKFNDFTCWEPQAFICSYPY